MKERKVNKRDKPLEDLLKRAAGGDLQDDFEREAAEGFRLIGEEDAYASKASADKRVSALFERKRRNFGFPAAAAAVLIVVSLTVYFLRDNVRSEQDPLAHTSHAQKQEVLSPAGTPHPEPLPQIRNEQESEGGEKKPITTLKEKTTVAPPPLPLDASSPVADAENSIPAGAGSGEKPEADAISAVQSGQAAPEAVPSVPPEKKTSAKSKDRRNENNVPAAQSEPMAFASRAAAVVPDSTATYISSALKKNLPPELNLPFEATLDLSPAGKVTSVKFDKTSLDRSGKKRLKGLLLELDIPELKKTGGENQEIKFRYLP